MTLAGRTALVTGGARRLGLSIARELKRAGATVIVSYRSPSPEVEEFDEGIEADLTTRHGVEALLPHAERADILINSAGNFIRETFGTITWENFDESVAVNMRAPTFLCQAAGMAMSRRGWGRIVNIADVAATIPFPAYLPYSMTKAAVVSLTRGAAKALAPHVLVNAIAPGPVLPPDDFNPEQLRQAIERTLLKRTGTASDIAKAVRFLIESPYITGITLPVDGGRLLR
jgi:pteridine reductase